MGWARTLLLGDIGNRLDIADTEQDIDGIRRELSKKRRRDRSQDERIEQLQRENEQLELCLAAVIRKLVDRGILQPDEVANLAKMVDDDPE